MKYALIQKLCNKCLLSVVSLAAKTKSIATAKKTIPSGCWRDRYSKHLNQFRILKVERHCLKTLPEWQLWL